MYLHQPSSNNFHGQKAAGEIIINKSLPPTKIDPITAQNKKKISKKNKNNCKLLIKLTREFLPTVFEIEASGEALIILSPSGVPGLALFLTNLCEILWLTLAQACGRLYTKSSRERQYRQDGEQAQARRLSSETGPPPSSLQLVYKLET